MHFFKKNGLVHGFLQKKLFRRFLLGKIAKENVFDNILNRKKGFLDKTINLKKSKNCFFPKGLAHGVC